MNNYKIVPPLFVIVLLCLGLFSSCTDESPIVYSNDPIVVDSNLFDWKLDTILTKPMKYFYVADTNNIFIAGFPYSVHINNGLIQYINHNDWDFSPYCLNGTSLTNVYIGGNGVSSGNSKLKRWNGTVIENIILPADTTDRIVRIEPISDNDIWMSTASNTIYHYVNNTVTTYKLDKSLDYGIIFRDELGNLYAQFDSYFVGSLDFIFSIYKYENNTWTQVYRDSVTRNSEMQYYIGFGGTKMLRTGKTGIYYFTGSEFLSYIHLGSHYTPLLAGASGPNNTLFLAEENNFNTNIFYYDGKKVYKTPNQHFPSLPNEEMQYKFDRFYFLIDISQYENYFGTAKQRNNKSS